jgi:hypothetical protein
MCPPFGDQPSRLRTVYSAAMKTSAEEGPLSLQVGVLHLGLLQELNERANATFGKAAAGVRQRISDLRSTVGSPWTQDEKTAALAGLIVCDKKH